MGVSPTEEQRRILQRLGPALPEDAYLGGGVAVAVHLGHRLSRDLDLFAPSDPTSARARLERLSEVVVTGTAPGTLQLEVAGIPVSLLHYPYGLVSGLEHPTGLALPVAALDDLASMKLAAIAGRGAARDFWDLHEIIGRTGKPLVEQLATFRRKFPAVDTGHVVRSLAYFDDAEAEPLPLGLAPDEWRKIRHDFELWVTALP